MVAEIGKVWTEAGEPARAIASIMHCRRNSTREERPRPEIDRLLRKRSSTSAGMELLIQQSPRWSIRFLRGVG